MALELPIEGHKIIFNALDLVALAPGVRVGESRVFVHLHQLQAWTVKAVVGQVPYGC